MSRAVLKTSLLQDANAADGENDESTVVHSQTDEKTDEVTNEDVATQNGAQVTLEEIDAQNRAQVKSLNEEDKNVLLDRISHVAEFRNMESFWDQMHDYDQQKQVAVPEVSLMSFSTGTGAAYDPMKKDLESYGQSAKDLKHKEETELAKMFEERKKVLDKLVKLDAEISENKRKVVHETAMSATKRQEVMMEVIKATDESVDPDSVKELTGAIEKHFGEWETAVKAVNEAKEKIAESLKDRVVQMNEVTKKTNELQTKMEEIEGTAEKMTTDANEAANKFSVLRSSGGNLAAEG